MSLSLIDPYLISNEVYYSMLTKDEKYEKFFLDGLYGMKSYLNPHPNIKDLVDLHYEIGGLKHLHSKQIYVSGNILYKMDEPHIEELIDRIIKTTYEEALPSDVDTTVCSRKQMRWGTICPTREVVYRHDGKLYVLYGRYIYGYDFPYVLFQNEKPDDDGNEDDDGDDEDYEDYEKKDELSAKRNEKPDDDGNKDDYGDDEDYEDYEEEDEPSVKQPLLGKNEIILPVFVNDRMEPNYAEHQNEYEYSFCILEENTNKLLAFSVYR